MSRDQSLIVRVNRVNEQLCSLVLIHSGHFFLLFSFTQFWKGEKRGNEDRRSINEPERGEEKEEEKVTDCWTWWRNERRDPHDERSSSPKRQRPLTQPTKYFNKRTAKCLDFSWATRLLWMWRTHEILKLRCFIQVSNSFNKAESNEEIDEPQRNKMQICNRSNSIEIEFKRRGALDGRD